MWISCSVEHFHSPAWLVLPWCLSLVQLEVRMQTAPRLRKALTEFPRSVFHRGTWTRLYAGDFPMLIRPRGGATGFHHQPGLKGSELVLPHETEAGNFHLAPGPESLKWNQQQAAGLQKSPRSINARGQGCKLSSEHKVKGWGAKHRNLTIPVCHCLWRCQCLLFSSWEAGTRLDLVLILTADTSANDGRTWFMQ